jgi:uncharacterized membrane protein YedE/YeeE
VEAAGPDSWTNTKYSLLVTLLQKLGYTDLKARSYSSLNLFSPLDGNIIGGLLQGFGMALSGACAGTVFVQVGAGVPSGVYTLVGSTLGGILWSNLARPLAQARAKKVDNSQKKTTVHAQFGVGQIATVVGVEAIFSLVIVASHLYNSTSPTGSGLVRPEIGGILIALSQLFSIASRNSLLGTSTTFEELGDFFSSFVNPKEVPSNKPKSYSAITLTTGMMVGALVVSSITPSPRISPQIWIGPIRAIIGGVLIAVGSRMAGGCTSGHGISGISLLSVSSFVTVVSMFAGGIGLATMTGL